MMVAERTREPSTRPVVNLHVHVPPNFSAFEDAEDVVGTAAREGVGVVGASNFHDLRVYGRFARAAGAAGVVPIFGIEFITVVEPLRAAGTRINDPANPGRMYLCGKGVNPFTQLGGAAARIDAGARAANRARAERMTDLLRERFTAGGVPTALDDVAIAADVASRAGVPADWVVLQERHLAMAFQRALFASVGVGDRAARLAAIFGVASSAAPDDAIAVQGEIRSRLMKAGGPAFVEESAMSFEDGVQLVLAWDGIPSYPTLGDGVSPVCPFEDGPEDLAARLRDLGIHAAELIPTRNAPEAVDAYVRAFGAAGIIVTAGTEHNTPDRIPLEPRAIGGAPISNAARDAFYEGACVVAGHQFERARGGAGFVDAEGRLGSGDPAAWVRRYAEIGAAAIAARSPVS